jgi:hypothetical protein
MYRHSKCNFFLNSFKQNFCQLRARPHNTASLALVAALLLVLSGPKPAFAAESDPDPVSGPSVHVKPQLDFDLSHIGHGSAGHFCGTDMTSPSARASVEAYLAGKRAGLYPAVRKGGYTPDIGAEQEFKVSEGTTFIRLNFRLVDTTSLYNLWVEVAEITNGNVSNSDISSLKSVIHDSTPSRSINPSQGLFANNNDVFGLPPNIDGDGIVDVLMYDIGRGSGSTLGYVSSADAVLNPPADQMGNGRDILYLDSDQGTSNLATLAVIAAHEYAHLIHLSYGWDTTFVTEGYAEYAMVMNGYYWRGVNFTNSITETTQPLFTWRDGGGPGAMDYERGGLFFTFLAERVGTMAIGQMMQGLKKKGGAGIDSVLTMHGENLSDLIRDYHTANYLNDTSIAPEFGYSQPERSFHNIPISSAPINGELSSDEGEGGFSHSLDLRVNAGAANLFRFNNVANFEFTYDLPTSAIFGDDFREQVLARNAARIVLRRADSDELEIHELVASPEDLQRFEGRFQWILFILTHGKPDLAVGDKTKLEAFWTPLSEVTDVEDGGGIPTSWTLERNYPNPFNPSTTIPLELDRTTHARLEVYNLLGKRMTTLNDGVLAAGRHQFRLDAASWTSGTYLIRLTTDSGVQSLPLTLLK